MHYIGPRQTQLQNIPIVDFIKHRRNVLKNIMLRFAVAYILCCLRRKPVWFGFVFSSATAITLATTSPSAAEGGRG